MYDSDSDDSVITTTSVGSTTDDDIVWVEEDIGDNCVRVRYVKEGKKNNYRNIKTAKYTIQYSTVQKLIFFHQNFFKSIFILL